MKKKIIKMYIVQKYIEIFKDQIKRFISEDDKKVLTDVHILNINVLNNVDIEFKKFIEKLEK